MTEQLPLFSTPARSDVAPAGESPQARRPPHGGLTAQSPLNAAILAWREHLERERSSPHTVKSFGGDLNLFAEFSGGGKGLHQLATRDLDNWLQWQRTVKKCSPKTYARRVTSLKSFFRWLHQSSVLPNDPAAPLIQQTVLSPLPEYLTDAEVEAALQGAQVLRTALKPDPRPCVLFTLLLHTGIKKGECLTLIPNHVDLSNPDEPVLWIRYPDPRHRHKERKLRLDPAWLSLYREYLTRYEPRDTLFPWSARRLEYMLEDVSQAAGLTKHISFDMCRWTCAVRDARGGMDHNQIRQKLGLSKIQWREVGMKLDKLVSAER
jgi:integrase/recombinase XerD